MRKWAIVGLAMLAASCGDNASAPAPAEATPSPAASAQGIVLSDARVQLPVVSGRPGAAYFTLTQATGAARKLTGVTVALAGRAEMHETVGGTMKPLSDVALTPGTTLKFEPGGKHVMLFDLDPKLRFQKEVALTVTLDDGERATAQAAVTTVAETMEGMH